MPKRGRSCDFECATRRRTQNGVLEAIIVRAGVGHVEQNRIFFLSFPSSRARQWSANSTDCGELGVESTRTDLPVPIELIS